MLLQIQTCLLFLIIFLSKSISKLNVEQQQKLACTISEETEQSPERVFTSSGVYCGQDISNINETQTQLNKTEDSGEYYEYFVVLSDPYSADGSLDEVKEVVESEDFQEAVQETVENKQFGEGYTVEDIQATEQVDDPMIPSISNPNIYPNQTQITLNFKGATNTLGFIFVGLTEQIKESKPTKTALQFNKDYNFSAHNAQFYQKNSEQNITFVGLNPCTEFKYYWIASNEDPATYQYSTEVQGEAVNTSCVQEYANIIQLIGINLFLFIFLLK